MSGSSATSGQRARQLTLTALVIALGVGLLLSLINPGLLVWVAVGVLLPFTPDAVRRARRAGGPFGRLSRRRRAGLLAAGLVLTLVALPFLLANEEADFRPRSSVVVEADYTGKAALRGDPERLALTDTLSIRRSTLEAAARAASKEPRVYRRSEPPPGGSFEQGLEQDIGNGLAAEGWREAAPSTEALAFSRRRDHPLDLPKVKAQGTTTLTVPHPQLETEPPSDYFIEVPAANASRLVVTAEKRAIAGTFPEGDTQSHQVDDDLETTVVPRPETSEAWELRVRRNLFREEPFVRIADFTFGNAAIGILLGLLALLGALAKDELTEVLKRLLDRILKRPKEKPA